MTEAEIHEIELRLFLDAVRERHGYDFSHYARASLKRRVLSLAGALGVATVAELIPRALRDPDFLARALAQLSVPVTDMFRDPPVFQALAAEVLPLLGSYPHIAIWQAGCATGEECYSLAILLHEQGLLRRCQIYATDINDVALAKAEEGIYPAAAIDGYQRNYHAAGGSGRLGGYFHTAYGFSKINDEIRGRIAFAHHNLVADGVFCEVNLVMCRNVLIYFDRTLQRRVVSLFHDSLVRGGYLCLGNRESLQASGFAERFRALDKDSRIFRKEAA